MVIYFYSVALSEQNIFAARHQDTKLNYHKQLLFVSLRLSVYFIWFTRIRHSFMPPTLRSFFSQFGTGHERFLQQNKQEQQETYEYRGPINV